MLTAAIREIATMALLAFISGVLSGIGLGILWYEHRWASLTPRQRLLFAQTLTHLAKRTSQDKA